MKRIFEMTVARINGPDLPAIIVVRLPWDHFCHLLGPPSYTSPISKAKYLGVPVSLKPGGGWHCAGPTHEVWRIICQISAPEDLGWHQMKVEGDSVPAEEVQKMIDMGFLTAKEKNAD